MSSEAGRATAHLLREALGRVLQVPYAIARKGTPEFDAYWKLLDPALLAIYLALEAVEPESVGDSLVSPTNVPDASTDAGRDSEEGTEPEPAMFPSPSKVLAEAGHLLEHVVAGLPELIDLDHETRADIAERCAAAQDTIRQTMQNLERRAG
jgi:hypothetical protein